MVSARSTCGGRGVHLLSHGADTIRTICTEGATATHSFHHQLVEMFCPGMHTLHLNYYGYSLYQKNKTIMGTLLPLLYALLNLFLARHCLQPFQKALHCLMALEFLF